MPYIVPLPTSPIPSVPATGSVSASESSSTPPHSPSHPPIALTMALASPASIPAHTIPFSPPPNIQSFGAVARGRGVNGIYPPHVQAPPLVKALSDMNTPTKAGGSGSISSSKEVGSTGARVSPPMRRTASASSAETTPGMFRYANAAGSSLPRVPRRNRGSFASSSTASVSTSSSASSSISTSASSQLQNQSPIARGRTRSRFVLGAEECESGSGSDAESKEREKNGNGKENSKAMGVEERAERKRPISAERSMALKIVPSSSFAMTAATADSSTSLLSNSSSASLNSAEFDHEHSESGSECATPTPSSIAKGQKAREKAFALQGAVPESTTDHTDVVHVFGKSNIPGIAPRARRGRGSDGVKKLIFGEWLDDEGKDGKSTVAFPSSVSPVPAIAVAGPSPELVSDSSPPQKDNTQKGFSSKRNNASSLRLNFSFGGTGSGLNTGASGQAVAEEMLTPSLGRTLSESVSMSNMPLIRKKSGEVVRSSLKSRSNSAGGARHRPSLSLSDIALFPMTSPSVSAPATPEASTAKMVHFDAQLEHVKLFLSGQKPAAVSRDGSPTGEDTTSGGEGDSASEGTIRSFSARPRGRRRVPGGSANEEEEAVRRLLMMRVLNMPIRTEDDDEDVRLEGLHLADDAVNVEGIVRVRNIAFEKNVVIRFTFDGWQTTSEVIGKWVESCVPALSIGTLRPRSVSLGATKADGPPMATFDRFSFSIRLADMLLRIDEKTLVLAVRYSSGGQEMWDNNGGQNYRAVFERRPQTGLTLAKSAALTPSAARREKDLTDGQVGKVVSGVSIESGVSTSGSIGASLHSALDKVVAGANAKDTDGELFSSIKKTSDLASRYDLGASLKNHSMWRPTFDHSQTWAGQGKGRNEVFMRTPLPWSVTKNGSPLIWGQPSVASTTESTKTRKFESHKVSFNSRGLPRGSPRDVDLDTMDESDVERISRAHLAFPGAGCGISTPDGEPFPRFRGTTFSGDSFLGGPMAPTLAPASLVSTPEPHVRNHHRSYFDAWATLESLPAFGKDRVRVTPPGTPIYQTQSNSDANATPSTSSSYYVIPSAEYPPVASPGRHYSFPPFPPSVSVNGSTGLGLITSRPWTDKSCRLEQDADDSEASTPSITSVSSPTMTASPSSPPDWSMLSPIVHTSSGTIAKSESMDPSNYNVFLDKFCFYRGVNDLLDVPSTDIRRTHSASSVEELLSSSSPSSVEAFPYFNGPHSSTTPTASPVPTPPTSAGILASESAMFARIIG